MFSTKNVQLLWLNGQQRNRRQLYRLDQPLTFISSSIEINVPNGFITDLASVPHPFFSILPPSGQYAPATIIHDYLLCTDHDPKIAAKIFLEALEVLGVPRWQRTVMYYAVKWFGRRFECGEFGYVGSIKD